jgi:hypothetical protein
VLTDDTHTALLAALFVANLAVSYLLYRRVTERRAAGGEVADVDAAPAPGTPDEEAPGPETAGDRSRLTCSACGTPNDPDYRFCRRCVGELSASRNAAYAGDGPFGRSAR